MERERKERRCVCVCMYELRNDCFPSLFESAYIYIYIHMYNAYILCLGCVLSSVGGIQAMIANKGGGCQLTSGGCRSSEPKKKKLKRQRQALA